MNQVGRLPQMDLVPGKLRLPIRDLAEEAFDNNFKRYYKPMIPVIEQDTVIECASKNAILLEVNTQEGVSQERHERVLAKRIHTRTHLDPLKLPQITPTFPPDFITRNSSLLTAPIAKRKVFLNGKLKKKSGMMTHPNSSLPLGERLRRSQSFRQISGFQLIPESDAEICSEWVKSKRSKPVRAYDPRQKTHTGVISATMMTCRCTFPNDPRFLVQSPSEGELLH